MNSKYIVRQPIKDAENRIIGYEIQYHGENQALATTAKTSGERLCRSGHQFTISSP